MSTSSELHSTGILLACVTDKETEEIIRAVPLKNYDLKYDHIVGSFKDFIKHLKENRSPRILIIDISKSDLPINDISTLSEVCEPGIQIIVVGTRNDVGVFRELIRLGIKDYLVKPLTTNHLVRSIENVLSINNEKAANTSFSKFGKVVTFLGTKGGCGTTTLAVNCSWIMAEKQARRVALIDTDLQMGAMAQFLDLEVTSNFQELLEVPERIDASIIDRFMIKYTSHMMIMCGQTPLDNYSPVPADAFDPIIQSLIGSFHYTIFDLPRHFTQEASLNILSQSNIVVIVSDSSIVGLRDCHRYFELLKRHRPSDQQVILVINKSGEYKTGEIEISDFEEALERKVDVNIAFDGVKPLQALMKGKPVAIQGTSILTSSIEDLALKIMGKEISHKISKSWFNLSFSRE